MYRLATMHSVTDRQTDRRTDDIMVTIADVVRSAKIARQAVSTLYAGIKQ